MAKSKPKKLTKKQFDPLNLNHFGSDVGYYDFSKRRNLLLKNLSKNEIITLQDVAWDQDVNIKGSQKTGDIIDKINKTFPSRKSKK